MKKYMMMVVVIVGLMITGIVVYADTEDVEVPDWFTDMIEWRRGEIDRALEDGELTQEEAAAWLSRVDAMEDFHLEEGFAGYGNGPCEKDGRGYGGDRDFRSGCRRGGFLRSFDANR